MTVAPFAHTISDEAALRALYREPSALVRSKVRASIDEQSAGFIARSPFVLVATTGADGSVDVSPRGGPPGFVRLLDERRLVLPDLNGNNLLDSISNIVATGRIGMLFVVPGLDETLRVNGRAWITTDPDLLDRWTDELRRPKLAVGIEVDQLFVHCAKAFRRGRVWDPTSWGELAAGPDGLDILRCQFDLADDPASLRVRFEEGYAADLAADRAER